MIRPNRDSRVIVSSIIYLITRTRSRQVGGCSHPLHTSNHRGLVVGRGAFNRAFHTGAQKSLEWTIGRHLTALTRGLTHVHGRKSVLPQLSSSMQPPQWSPAALQWPSDAVQADARRTAGVGAGAGWTTSWPAGLLLPGSENSEYRDGTFTFPAATSTTLAATLLVPQQTWCCVHGQHVINSYMNVCRPANKPVLIR